MASSLPLRRAGLVAAAVASVFLLSACNPGGGAIEDYSGVPVSDHAGDAEGHEGAAEDEVQAAWLQQGGQIAVTIPGSSTCPVVGSDIRVVDKAGEGNRVAVDVVERDEDEVCTTDLVPHTTVFWTPAYVSTTEELTVEVVGETVTVPVK
ncbi:hypothetical protein [Agromyces bauzanensis]